MAEGDTDSGATRVCFVIAPIGPEESAVRKRSDDVLNEIIRPVVEESGYKAVRADAIAVPGIITNQVIDHVLSSELVVADLTGQNPNVFYELALRHALKKPFIQIVEAGEDLPFDVAVTRTIRVVTTDLRSAAECRKEMSRQLKAIEAGRGEVDSPISMAIDLQALRSSKEPIAPALATIQITLAELGQEVQSLNRGIGRFKYGPGFSDIYHSARTVAELLSSLLLSQNMSQEELQKVHSALIQVERMLSFAETGMNIETHIKAMLDSKE